MSTRFPEHVERLVADAERAAQAGDWAAARALAEAALALQNDHVGARHVLRSAQTSLARAGERRQLTVMFTDIVGSTQLSSRADPETIRDILRSYQGTCAEVIGHYDGHVANYIGDGILAYFGYPSTHEDDAERAVRCGLDLLDALEEVRVTAAERYRLPFAIRVAVHTGLVVRAEMGSRALRDVDAIVGATPNVAARLQEHAQPGSMIISSATYDLVRDKFEVVALDPLNLRGIPAPVEAYHVVGERQAGLVPPTPFCNRASELAELSAAWEDAADATCRAVVICGEPGIGKSRLAEELRSRVEAAGQTTLRAGCSSFHRTTELYPVRRLVEQASGIDSRDAPEETLPRLREALAAIGKDDLLGVFADLLGLPPGDGWEPPELDGPQLHEVTLTALADWVATAAIGGPTLVLIDDIQWADPSTMDLIGRVLARRLPGLLLVVTAREEFVPPWTDGVRSIRLERFTPDELRVLAAALPDAEQLQEAVLDEAISRSDGIPLFLEELLRAADGPVLDLPADADMAIPPVLVGRLLARLAAPGVDLGLCQAIAAIGREADLEVLAALVGLPDDTLDMKLRHLVDSRLIESAGGEHPVYRFRHDLLRELAYETLLHPERRRLHSAIADILDAIDIHGVPGDNGLIAYHLEQAGRVAGAVEAYTRTARQALAHGALHEAIEQLDLCLKLLDEVGDARRRAQLELTVRQVRGLAWVSARGYSAPGAVEDFRRCVELCEVLGAEVDPIGGVEAIWYYYLLHGELDRAETLMANTLASVAARTGQRMPEEGFTSPLLFLRGRFTAAIEEMERFLATPWAKASREVPPDWPLPDDPIVNIASFLGLAYWIAGNAGASRLAFDRAKTRAQMLAFPHGPFGMGYAVQIQLITARIGLLDDEADRLAAELEAIADRHGFGFYKMSATGQHLISTVRRGAGTAVMEQVSDMVEMLGIGVWMPLFRLYEAMVSLRDGDPIDSVKRADRALAASEESGARFLCAEIARVRGEARLASGDPLGVQDIDDAIALARAQGARLFELRASLARRRAPGGATILGELTDLVQAMDGVHGLPELEEARGTLEHGSRDL